jgi:RNA polymerase sigma factor (sigma-70 family)
MILREPFQDAMSVEDGDEADAFAMAFHQVSRSAFLLARQLGKGTDEALDVVQEAALRAWRHRASRRAEFRPWFLAIVYRLAHNKIRDWLPLPEGWDRPAPDAVESAIDPELITALRRLPPRQRAAIWLRYVDDLPIADVARVMNCRETAAKQLLLRGRDALRRTLISRPMEDPK